MRYGRHRTRGSLIRPAKASHLLPEGEAVIHLPLPPGEDFGELNRTGRGEGTPQIDELPKSLAKSCHQGVGQARR